VKPRFCLKTHVANFQRCRCKAFQAPPPGFDIGFFATGEITKQMGDTYFPKKNGQSSKPTYRGDSHSDLTPIFILTSSITSVAMALQREAPDFNTSTMYSGLALISLTRA